MPGDILYQQLVENLPDAVLVHVEGEIVYMNTAAVRLFKGERHESFIGRQVLSLVHPEEQSMIEERIEAVNDHRMNTSQIVVRALRENGDTVYVESQGVPVMYEGQPAGLVQFRDVTLRQQLEEERERLINDLDAYSRMVAHDLKNPLALIVGLSEYLGENYHSSDPFIIEEITSAITKHGQRMANIIDEILLLAHVRNMEVITDVIPMAPIVEESLDRLAYMIKDYDAHMHVAEEWPHVRGHHPWIEQLWINYISNALKYGGRPPVIGVGADEPADGMVRLWVEDNGPGLTKKAIGQLFMPFAKLSEVSTKGHGLGLSIVKRIVERLGGEVGVESEPGQGSRFWFTLPTE